jgi:hypothetical protein
MTWVILVLALPLVGVALAAIFRRPQPLAPPPTPPPTTWKVFRRGRSVILWAAFLTLLLAGFLFVTADTWLGNRIRLLVLCRHGVLAGLLLVGLVPLGLWVKPDLLGNLFVLRSPWGLFHLGWMASLTATMAVAVCRVEERNACVRFQTECTSAATGPWNLGGLAAMLVLGLPVLIACANRSRQAWLAPPDWRWGPWVAALVGGPAAALLLLVTAAFVQRTLLSRDVLLDDLFPLQPLGEWLWGRLGEPRWEGLAGLEIGLARLIEAPGYTEGGGTQPLHVAPGHLQVGSGMAVVVVLYVGYYLLVHAFGIGILRAAAMPPLFLLLLLILFLGFFLQGAAFALDLFWLPAMAAVVLVVLVIYQVFQTDHLFSLGKTDAAGGVRASAAGQPPRQVPTWQQVAAGWQLPPVAGKADAGAPRRTLVAVTAAGGGIQAAAWTVRALVGLHALYGDPFTRSIRLLSAVSGGSVGAMYFLDAWQRAPAQALPDKECQPWAGPLPPAGSLCDRAMGSSLEATVWGLVFPDLLRLVVPFLVRKTDDRGARIEEAWRQRLRQPETRLDDWIDRVQQGDLPVPVFNSTIVETGQRFLAAPVLNPRHAPVGAGAEARQLFDLYPDARPLVSTMVRLSATFPYVSPICRPERHPQDRWLSTQAYHFADGGYVDNEGLVTVIEWLHDLLGPATRPFDRILLVRLMPFPGATVAMAEERGWYYSTWGPVKTMENVRTASQQERNGLAIQLFREAAAQRGVEVKAVELRYRLGGTTPEPPLSWMLTAPQKAAVNEAWRQLCNGNQPLATIEEWFPRVS